MPKDSKQHLLAVSRNVVKFTVRKDLFVDQCSTFGLILVSKLVTVSTDTHLKMIDIELGILI